MAIPIPLIAAGLSAVPSILNFIKGDDDNYSQFAAAERRRPKLGVTPATQEMVGAAGVRRKARMPGMETAKRVQQTSIANMLSSARRASTNPTDLLQIAAGGGAQEAALGAEMAMAQEGYTDQAERDYMASLGVLSDEQKDVFDYNQNMPFQRNLALMQAKMIADNQRRSQAFTNSTALLSSFLGSDMASMGLNELLRLFKTQQGG